MKYLLQVLTVALLVACGGGGGSDSGASSQPVAQQPVPTSGLIQITGAAVYDGGNSSSSTLTPQGPAWLGSVSRRRLIFFKFTIENGTSTGAAIVVQYNTDMRCDGGVPAVYSLLTDNVQLPSGQAITMMAAIYCPGAELGTRIFRPTLIANGVEVDRFDGTFDAAS